MCCRSLAVICNEVVDGWQRRWLLSKVHGTESNYMYSELVTQLPVRVGQIAIPHE
jgi:hypothetical protein